MQWLYFACLVAITGYYAHVGYVNTLHRITDWVGFEVGARVLVHYHHQPLYGDPRLHVYVDNPDLQIGPPALWLVAAFERFSFRTITLVFGWIMPALGVLGIVAIGRSGPAWPSTIHGALNKAHLALAGLLVGAIWGFEANQWKHLDDAMALSFTAVAVYLITKRRPWWLIGLLLGTAVATKPWAIILTPILLGLAREERSKAVLATVTVAAAWWAPFVIAAPDTMQALGHFAIQPHGGSVLYLVGFRGHVEGWLRPAQFVIGIAVGILAARRHGIYAAPIAALATRVLTDPYAYPYYAMGPLLFALLFDRGRPNTRWLIGLTELTALLDSAFSRIWVSPVWVASGKVAFGVLTLSWVFLGRSRVDGPGPGELDAAKPASGESVEAPDLPLAEPAG
jgi:hypothetical protein